MGDAQIHKRLGELRLLVREKEDIDDFAGANQLYRDCIVIAESLENQAERVEIRDCLQTLIDLNHQISAALGRPFAN